MHLNNTRTCKHTQKKKKKVYLPMAKDVNLVCTERHTVCVGESLSTESAGAQ